METVNKTVKGYKVFNPDWTCMGKQYSCPGKFKGNISLSVSGVCEYEMHFCKRLADCFSYYPFNPKNKVAEIVAYGTVIEEGSECCTDKIQIVRELSWQEVLDMVNTGKNCIGRSNSGDCNSGNKNSGDFNSGNHNSSDYNRGHHNSGNWNSGDFNSGDYNSEDFNSGNNNSGNRNSGNCNSGNQNSGNCNSGDFNSGDWNSGDWNSGDWNKADFSNGCFNTKPHKIFMFDKPSNITYNEWLNSKAKYILDRMPLNVLSWVRKDNMTDDERDKHSEYLITGGFLRCYEGETERQEWWDNLPADEKEEVMNIPNFDEKIFEEITGIKVTK